MVSVCTPNVGLYPLEILPPPTPLPLLPVVVGTALQQIWPYSSCYKRGWERGNGVARKRVVVLVVVVGGWGGALKG